MTKKVLLLGGSHAEIPLIKAMQNLACFEKTKGYCSKYILPLDKTLEGLKMLDFKK